MPITRTAAGKYQASYSNASRGIPRTRRTFKTRKQAQEWITAIDNDVHNQYLGNTAPKIFGQALAEYITSFSPAKKTHSDDISNAKALRWPIRHQGRWVNIDTVPLTPKDLLPVVNAMAHDWTLIQARTIKNQKTYHMRDNKWYYQPATTPRQPVTDKAVLAQLTLIPPKRLSKHTIRLRLALVKRIITVSYKNLQWIDVNFGDKIEMPRNLPSRKEIMTDEQFTRLINSTDSAHADLYIGMLEIGWRLNNIVQLEWDRVHWPVSKTDDTTGQTTELSHGYLLPKQGTSNKKTPPMPMSSQVETLLKRRWKLRQSHNKSESGFVFHRGNGAPFCNFHKRWKQDLLKAGIKTGITRHGLRHTWATNFCSRSGTATDLQALTGWTLATCQKYVHLTGAHIAAKYRSINNDREDFTYDQANRTD